MKINKIEDIKKFNIICTNAEEIKECLSILEKLKLPVNNNYKKYNNISSRFIVVHISYFLKIFDGYTEILDILKNISFYDFKKETKKFLIQAPQYNLKDVAFKSKNDEKAMIDYVKNNNVAIHCPTKEDYNKFTEILEKNGETWGSGYKFSKLNCYKCFKELTYLGFFYFKEWGYADIGGIANIVINHKILTVKELFDKFKIEKKENKKI